MHFISQPWPWYIAGPLIGLTVPILLIIGNKTFGISSSLRHLCAACVPANIPFFKYDWKKEIWNLFFVFGILIGGFIASHFMTNQEAVVIHPDLLKELKEYGMNDFHGIIPSELFNWHQLTNLKGITMMIVGGFLVGFGTRYAGGCTSGHAIMGLSNLQLPSLIATICFMIGGFIGALLLIPFILG